MDCSSMCNRMRVGGFIRPARRCEVPDIARLVTSAYAQFRDALSPAFVDAYLQHSCDFEGRWDEAELLVFELGGHIAGTISFYADASREGLGLPSDWAGFRTLAVHPAARGQGIARALVDACLARARLAGKQTVGIHTSDFMREALALYRGMGFSRCAEYDFRASGILGLDMVECDVLVAAYRLDLPAPDALPREPRSDRSSSASGYASQAGARATEGWLLAELAWWRRAKLATAPR